MDGPDLARALAERDVQLARLEERLAASDELKAELRRLVEQQRADLDRERSRQEELKAELQAERRRAEEAERRQAERDRQLDEVLRRLDELQDQARRSHRPGLRAWWRRVWEGEG